MKINVCFEYPDLITDPLVQSVERCQSDYLYQYLGYYLVRAFHDKYQNIQIHPIGSWGLTCSYCKYGTSTITIENPDTKKYFIISFLDNHLGMCEQNGFDLENCMGLFPHVGVHMDNLRYEKHPLINYIPNTIMSYYKSGYDRIEQAYKNKKSTPEKPFFRGRPYENHFRGWVFENDLRFDFKNERVLATQFIDELSTSTINIDFNSVAEISCRTVESLGLQTALIRPKLTIQYHDPLIPNYHYAAVDCDDLSNYKMLADSYIDKFEELKKDKEHVNFLSTNGRKWYKKNATIKSAIKMYLKLIDLYKLV